MAKKLLKGLIILVFGLAVCSWSRAVTEETEESLSLLLPRSAEVPGWERHDDFQDYKGGDLFFYINGGAEIYHEYGFQSVIVQDYKSGSGKSVSLEIYAMNDSLSAYGIYSFKAAGEGKPLELGGEGKLQDYYLNFWKGRYLVTLTGFDEEKETLQGLKTIARAVDSRIETPEPSKRPALTGLLPEKGLDPYDVKYFMGNLGLFNNYPFTTKNLFQIQEAVKGSYRTGHDVYLMKYSNHNTAQAILQKAAAALPQESRYQSVEVLGDSLRLIDENGTRILMKQHENFIIIVLGTEDFGSLDGIMQGLKDSMEGGRP